MSSYLDTSLIVAALVPEQHSTRVHDWLGKQAAGSLSISDWTLTEVASALAIKVRSGDLSNDQRAAVQAVWTAMRIESLNVLSISPTVFQTASIFIDQSTTGLRAGDALHLAIAASHGCTIATLDQALAKSAPICGVPVVKL